MISKTSRHAALAVTGLLVLAGCSSGDHRATAQDRSYEPAEAAVQAPAVAQAPEVSPGLLKRIQVSLRSEKLYTGHIDGVWGPQTQGAIHRYQQAHSLTDNGEIDSSTLASLKVASVASTAAPVTPVSTTAATAK